MRKLFVHSLDGDEVVLDLSAHAHEPIERSRELQRVRERKTRKSRIDDVSLKNGEKRGAKNDARADKLEAKAKPAVSHSPHVIGALILLKLYKN